MKLIIPIALIALLFSCGNTKETTETVSSQVQEETETTHHEVNQEIGEKKEEAATNIRSEKTIEIKAHFGEFVESDIIQINSAEISGNNLILSVTYSGGCEEQSFDMVGSQMVAKSLPPIRQLKLIHKKNGDSCRQLITKKVIVDVREMAINKSPGSEIILNLEGARGQISYIFQ